MNHKSQLKFQKQQSRHQQKGAGLMEVLIALLVLSIGILGLATLQSIGLKFNHQSYQRTQAVMQVYDIADRIRSNNTGRTTEYTAIPLAGPTGAVPTDCTVVICDGVARATFDIERWRQSLVAFLGPDAQGGISLDAGTRLHSIQVDWMENDVQKSFIYEAQLLSLL